MKEQPRPLPLIGGVLALVGAVMCVAALFSEYYRDNGIPGREYAYPRWFTIIFTIGVIAAGVLLVARRSTQVIGAAALSPSSSGGDRWRSG
jgi:hypothetical protein